ncbi:hypothetical protein D030_0325B, partial [Vibrio parahaemolyticus AQ3810]
EKQQALFVHSRTVLPCSLHFL